MSRYVISTSRRLAGDFRREKLQEPQRRMSAQCTLSSTSSSGSRPAARFKLASTASNSRKRACAASVGVGVIGNEWQALRELRNDLRQLARRRAEGRAHGIHIAARSRTRAAVAPTASRAANRAPRDSVPRARPRRADEPRSQEPVRCASCLFPARRQSRRPALRRRSLSRGSHAAARDPGCRPTNRWRAGTALPAGCTAGAASIAPHASQYVAASRFRLPHLGHVYVRRPEEHALG